MDQVEGTFTFLFTDIEGSTRLLRELGDVYPGLLAEHDTIMQDAAVAHGGLVFGSEGDAQFMAFASAGEAVRAAVDAQRALAAHAWPGSAVVRVRMGIHAGTARRSGSGFTGLALHAAARVTAAGHGGQVLLTQAARELVGEMLPAEVRLRDLGEHRLKDFDEPVRLHQLVIDSLASEFPPLRTRPVVLAHVPLQLTDFVGRAEVASVRAALASSRLVTLTGPGGTGKTRLAIEVASEVATDYPDGSWFVALDAVRDPALVASEIAMTLGLSSGADAPIDRLVPFCADRTALLVLDNLEQVVGASPDIARVLRDCPHIRVLATSRIPLDIYGERELPVPALAVPPEAADLRDIRDSEAVQLFVTRAAAARPGFDLDDVTAPLVADIVRRLDGLPLAIELAAARLRTLPLAALAQRLDDRLAILTGGGRDRPARQQTLRGAIEWSHDLLDEPDQRLFARLGVLAGAAPLELVEAVCGPLEELGREVFDGLESLAHQSLVRVTEGDRAGEPRFGMLATIREYARDRLDARGELALLHRRHAEAYLRLAESAAPHLLGPAGRGWNARLEACHDDLRAALDWVVEAGEAELGLRLITALWRFWQVRGHLLEGEVRANAVLTLPGAAAQAPELLARAEGAAGGISYWRSNIPATHRHYTRALEHAEASGDRALVAAALYDLGFAATDEVERGLQRYLAGEPYVKRALAIHRELGDRPGEVGDLWALHQAAAARGDVETSERLGRETLALARDLGDPFHTGWTAYTLAMTVTAPGQDRLDEGAALLAESLEVFLAADDRSGILLNIMSLAQLGLRAGYPEEAWRLLGAVTRINAELGVDLLNEDYAIGMGPVRRTPESAEEQRLFELGQELGEAEAEALAQGLARHMTGGRRPG